MRQPLDNTEKARRLVERLPVEHWLQEATVRKVEQRLCRYGLSRSMARTAIWRVKNRTPKQ